MRNMQIYEAISVLVFLWIPKTFRSVNFTPWKFYFDLGALNFTLRWRWVLIFFHFWRLFNLVLLIRFAKLCSRSITLLIVKNIFLILLILLFGIMFVSFSWRLFLIVGSKTSIIFRISIFYWLRLVFIFLWFILDPYWIIAPSASTLNHHSVTKAHHERCWYRLIPD